MLRFSWANLGLEEQRVPEVHGGGAMWGWWCNTHKLAVVALGVLVVYGSKNKTIFVFNQILLILKKL